MNPIGSENRIYSMYCLYFPNGKQYIGISCSPFRRINSHFRAALKGKSLPVHKAIRKFGVENINSKILVKGDEKYICELEIRAISTYNTKIPNGYNVRNGGQISPMLNLETAKKRGRSLTGYKHSEETKLKIKTSILKTMSKRSFREWRSVTSKGMQNLEMNIKKSISVKAAYQTEEVKTRHREALKDSWRRRKLLSIDKENQ